MPERVGVEVAADSGNAQQRSELRREREPSAGPAREVQRLDPEAVARGDELAPGAVEDREREHAVQLRERIEAARLVEPQHELGVRVVAAEADAVGLEPRAAARGRCRSRR